MNSKVLVWLNLVKNQALPSGLEKNFYTMYHYQKCNLWDLKMKHTKIVCPYCQSENIAHIVYGEVAFDEELNEALEKGEIHLGGCCYYNDSPKYHCNDCKKNFPESEHDPDKEFNW